MFFITRKKTISEIKDILDKNTQLELVSTEYVNRRTQMEFRCKRCGRIFKTTLASILSSSAKGKYKIYCNDCVLEDMHNRFAKTDKQFREEIYNILGNEYTVLGKYKNYHTKVDIFHKRCGYVWECIPYVALKQNGKCPRCYNTVKKTTESFSIEVELTFNGEFEVVGEYKNNHTPIKIKHSTCNRVFNSRPGNFMTNKSCPLCSKDGKSRGEEKIFNILQSMDIKFIREKRFIDCKNLRPLPFDFYIPSKNMIIEYDGEQHFKPKFNEKSFEDTKKNDKIKNEYCKSKNIKLIRIPYTEFDNIENILRASL